MQRRCKSITVYIEAVGIQENETRQELRRHPHRDIGAIRALYFEAAECPNGSGNFIARRAIGTDNQHPR
jgi:hypothetical protein